MSFPFSPDPADVASARRLAEASGYLIPPSLLPAFQYARADRQGELWMPATWGVLRGGRWRPTSWEPVSDFVDTWLFVEHDQPGWLPPGRDGEVTAAWEECLAAAAVADGQAANGQPAAVDVPPAPPPPPPAPPRPRWDLANRTLYLGDKVACRFQREAPRLFALLDLFEERGWPQTADCPRDFPAKNTVDNLNKKVAAAQLRFGRTDGDARVTWLLLTS